MKSDTWFKLNILGFLVFTSFLSINSFANINCPQGQPATAVVQEGGQSRWYPICVLRCDGSHCSTLEPRQNGLEVVLAPASRPIGQVYSGINQGGNGAVISTRENTNTENAGSDSCNDKMMRAGLCPNSSGTPSGSQPRQPAATTTTQTPPPGGANAVCDTLDSYDQQSCISEWNSVNRPRDIPTANAFILAVNGCPGSSECIRRVYESVGIKSMKALKSQLGIHNRNIQGYGSVDTLIQAYTSHSYRQEQTKLLKICGEKQEDTNSCCQEPMKCLAGKSSGGKMAGDAVNMLLTLTGQAAAVKGSKGACELAEKIGQSGAAANAGLAQMCRQKVKTCVATCTSDKYIFAQVSEPIQKACKDYQSLTRLRFSDGNLCTVGERLSESIDVAEGRINSCINSKENAANTEFQSVNLLASSALYKQCKDIVGQNSNNQYQVPDDQAAFSGDCTGLAGATNPTCIACNQDPTLPQCAGLTLKPQAQFDPNGPNGGVNNPSINPTTNNALNDPSAMSDGTELAFDEQAYSNMEYGDQEKIAPNDSRTQSMGGGGGSIPGGGGGGGGMGGLQAEQQPQSPNGPLNTDILGGERGGGGALSGGGGGSMGFNSFGGFGSNPNGDIALNPKDTMDAWDEVKHRELAGILPGYGVPLDDLKIATLDEFETRLPASKIGKESEELVGQVRDTVRNLCVRGQIYGCKYKASEAKIRPQEMGDSVNTSELEFDNIHANFKLPQGWSCFKDDKTWVCRDQRKQYENQAVIVVALKEKAQFDNNDFYAERLQSEALSAWGLNTRFISFKRERKDGKEWLDAHDLESVAPNFMTRSYLTTDSYKPFIISVSAQKDVWNTSYRDKFDRVISSLRLKGKTEILQGYRDYKAKREIEIERNRPKQYGQVTMQEAAEMMRLQNERDAIINDPNRRVASYSKPWSQNDWIMFGILSFATILGVWISWVNYTSWKAKKELEETEADLNASKKEALASKKPTARPSKDPKVVTLTRDELAAKRLQQKRKAQAAAAVAAQKAQEMKKKKKV